MGDKTSLGEKRLLVELETLLRSRGFIKPRSPEAEILLLGNDDDDAIDRRLAIDVSTLERLLPLRDDTGVPNDDGGVLNPGRL